jgi:cephalosporin hydroxylase
MTRYLENSTDMPLGEVLAVIQDRIMTRTTYFGVPTYKNPMDFWVYQELVHERKPDVIVEIGNHRGGSALALAHLLDNIGHGRLIAVDTYQKEIHPLVRAHPRIAFVEGRAGEVYPEVRARIREGERVMVIEDSAHTYDNTLAVLRKYGDLLRTGDVFIVEDSICHHGLDVGPNPGPYEAIEAFIADDDRFEIDRSRESFLITWNPKGFLVRR